MYYCVKSQNILIFFVSPNVFENIAQVFGIILHTYVENFCFICDGSIFHKIFEMATIRTSFFLIIFLLVVSTSSAATNILTPAKNAPNIIRITTDSIILASGVTRSFTVDTPEDQGLVSTGISAYQLSKQLVSTSGLSAEFATLSGNNAKNEELKHGDILEVTAGKTKQRFNIGIRKAALAGTLSLHRPDIRVDTDNELILDFTAGQRSPMTKIRVDIPKGIHITTDNTFVDVIGRGEVSLKELPTQSIGRTGTNYSYKQVGSVNIADNADGSQTVTFSDIDLRPANGADLRIRITRVNLQKSGDYTFKASYTTSEPEVFKSTGTKQETATLTVVNHIADLRRMSNQMSGYSKTPASVDLCWTPANEASKVTLLQSVDKGRTWTPASTVGTNSGTATIRNLSPNKLYAFKLDVKGGKNKGNSNIAWFYSGKINVKEMGVKGDGVTDDTDSINNVIAWLNSIGGGTIEFTRGTYNMRTVHLKSNVWLYINSDAVLQALPDNDAPEATWFSDRAYRSGLSPTDSKPYADPENYLTKQDVGHTFFRNAMFFAERENNIKIIGTGRITGAGNLQTSDGVMKNDPDKRADKMFSLKLCSDIEIGGILSERDLWYDEEKDEPYYINPGDNGKDFDVGNMLHIDRGGHFVLLATGSDNIHVHNTYFAKANSGNARDIYDFMACNNVVVANIYSKVSSDDIVKLGSDCSLGFTRPVSNYMVRNIIGDTNCNLFQIGSETADDIQDVYVDNIYVLGANKAGFSISTNDGAHVKNIFLNSGRTGSIHSRSKMLRTRTPFFISISNRGRTLGADVAMCSFEENGITRKELLCTNSSIGKVENIFINAVDIAEVYAGSSFRGGRWKEYDGSQNKSSPIIAGYSLPNPKMVEGGLNFVLPDGRHTGYITNIRFNDVNLLVKGGHPVTDSDAYPPEIGVGRYNVGDLKTQPAYGFWVRHVKSFELTNSAIAYENQDLRHPVVLDDVIGAKIKSLQIPSDNRTTPVVKEINSSEVVIDN